MWQTAEVLGIYILWRIHMSSIVPCFKGIGIPAGTWAVSLRDTLHGLSFCTVKHEILNSKTSKSFQIWYIVTRYKILKCVNQYFWLFLYYSLHMLFKYRYVEPLTLTTAQHLRNIALQGLFCDTDNLTKHYPAYYTASHQISNFLDEILMWVEIIS